MATLIRLACLVVFANLPLAIRRFPMPRPPAPAPFNMNISISTKRYGDSVGTRAGDWRGGRREAGGKREAGSGKREAGSGKRDERANWQTRE
ncbi:hypothetical protein E4U43_006149 [Claviceps pusilla]|uniref:Secreted protein n=1 Tax=Claviceps pusilla TaxID=123648 RepID=A0A9P7N2N2_9HYPO|nr:hypothetical protein E4U43_006149 [Claviceps pusilla]